MGIRETRRTQKAALVRAFGSSCQHCAYKGCDAVYDFHHIKKKIFGIADKLASYSWERIVEEARKCIMLCANCHREVHEGTIKVIIVPGPIKDFDYSPAKKTFVKDYCGHCGEEFDKNILSSQAFCSCDCANGHRGKVDWKTFDLEEELKTSKSISEVARKLKVSFTAVKKRMKKLGLSV